MFNDGECDHGIYSINLWQNEMYWNTNSCISTYVGENNLNF